jgi:diacylglycerol kinase family enzyme
VNTVEPVVETTGEPLKQTPPWERWAVVVNPTKFEDLDALKTRFAVLCAEHGWSEASWYTTTAEDPGEGQAKQALTNGAGLVCPLGGDGTVRAVAAAMVDSGVPMGLLPGGTGNLLARNLKLPVDDLEAALIVALTGKDAAIDVGEVSWDGQAPTVFLVMAGMGLDAEMMAGVDEGLKKKVGWLAYAVSGARALFRLGFGVRVRADSQRAVSQHARAVVVGNCGELAGGLQLMPDASITDGKLDTVLASPNSIAGWLALGLNFVSARRRGHPSIVRLVSDRVDVATREPVEAQLDGDAVGPRRRMTCSVRAGALTVRLPAEEQSAHST